MPNGPMRITSGPFEPDLYKSEMEVQDAELKVSVAWRVMNITCPVMKALRRAAVLAVTQSPQKLLPSLFKFLGPPSEFCKSENPEKKEKEGVY